MLNEPKLLANTTNNKKLIQQLFFMHNFFYLYFRVSFGIVFTMMLCAYCFRNSSVFPRSLFRWWSETMRLSFDIGYFHKFQINSNCQRPRISSHLHVDSSSSNSSFIFFLRNVIYSINIGTRLRRQQNFSLLALRFSLKNDDDNSMFD